MKSAVGFLNYVQARCAQAGIEFVLSPTKMTRDGDIGVFDDVKKRLTVCAAREDWLTTVAHECAHMDQWFEAAKVWTSCREDDWLSYDAWLAGKQRVTPRALVGITRRIQRVELDAERRALHMIREHGLAADVPAYVRAANHGVWQYEVARRLGRWPDPHPEAIKLMPDRLMRVSEIGSPPADFGLG